jgi:adenine-specific DNA-methyltransferase
MAKTAKRRTSKATPTPVETYRHPEATSLLRPDVGTQAQFRKKKPPQTYRYDSSLSPALDWDGGNGARELGEWLIRCIEQAAQLPSPHTLPEVQTFKDGRGAVIATVRNLQDAVEQLRRLSGPFLNWAGKAERLSFDVPTLPLFIHERLSTQAILETLKGHKRDRQMTLLDLFGDPQHSIPDQVLRAYEHANGWTNRLILGDSLVVMNSLLHYEGLGGQVQMIYMDPPYGVEFGSNFQPFVRTRTVAHNDDEDMTREPEMVKAYRDTWELSLHSYLTYMRDRLLLCHDLLTRSGSIFVQISHENLHHVREVMDEVFGEGSFVAVIPFRKKTMPLGAKHIESVCDYILWYGRDIVHTRFNRLYVEMDIEGDSHWNYVEFPDGTRRKMTKDEINNHALLPKDAIPLQLMSLYPVGVNRSGVFKIEFRGKSYEPPEGNSWFTNPGGMQKLIDANRVEPYEDGETLRYVLKASDGLISQLTNLWDDTSAPRDKIYAVQTDRKVIERCMLMTTDPGDLVLDPTCGSGTTPYVSEKWGRRWIGIDVSRVPLALARQRLLTTIFSYYELKDEKRGPAGGFVYKYKENERGQQIGGIIHSITRGTIANNEAPDEIVLVDRPEEVSKITRVTGPFTVEATIPTPVDWEGDGEEDSGGEVAEDHGSFVDRMLEVLRKSPVLHVGGGKAVTLQNVRPPAKTLALSAEALVDVTAPGQRPTLQEAVQEAEEKRGQALPLSKKPVAIVFGPENGAVSEKLVYEAAREAYAKSYTHLYVIGFSIQSNARELVEKCEAVVGVPATYVQATPDLMMGDLLKNMRSSQIFSVCGLPEVRIRKVKPKYEGEPVTYQVELLGLDVFDPATMEAEHRRGDDVPAWLLDTDYNNLCFHAGQVFFPRTSAWDALKRALRGTHEDSVWDHLSGTVSAPFEAGEHGQVAVKVIDDRGNELLVVKSLKEAEG